MPVIELDMLIGLVNPSDRLHTLADELFSRISSGRIKGVRIASSALLEYELLLRSRGYPESEIRMDIEAFRKILPEVPINSDVILRASELREKSNLTYFDSLHASSALNSDGIIVSSDKDYRVVKGIKAITPDDFLKK